MPILMILLLIGVLAYLFWQRQTTALTRNCRWRRIGEGQWRCAYCGTRTPSQSEPIACLRQHGKPSEKK